MPVLAFLTPEQLLALIGKQLPTEEHSLLQWTRSLGVEPPLPPDNVTEALEGAMQPPGFHSRIMLNTFQPQASAKRLELQAVYVLLSAAATADPLI